MYFNADGGGGKAIVSADAMTSGMRRLWKQSRLGNDVTKSHQRCVVFLRLSDDGYVLSLKRNRDSVCEFKWVSETVYPDWETADSEAEWKVDVLGMYVMEKNGTGFQDRHEVRSLTHVTNFWDQDEWTYGLHLRLHRQAVPGDIFSETMRRVNMEFAESLGLVHVDSDAEKTATAPPVEEKKAKNNSGEKRQRPAGDATATAPGTAVASASASASDLKADTADAPPTADTAAAPSKAKRAKHTRR